MPTDNYQTTANTKAQIAKPFDLEERTLLFAKQTRRFVKSLRKTLGNLEDGRQLLRASGSVGANYIEAREALSQKDRVHRLRIVRKEAKESAYWFALVDTDTDSTLEEERVALRQEALELMYILHAIIEKQHNAS